CSTAITMLATSRVTRTPSEGGGAMKLTPSRTLAELMSQHDALRVMMTTCEGLADELDLDPSGDPTPLVREIARLRVAFEAHNRFEEQLLRPVLLEHDQHGPARIERMVEDHVNEHRTIVAQLDSPATAPMTAALRDVIETLRA